MFNKNLLIKNLLLFCLFFTSFSSLYALTSYRHNITDNSVFEKSCKLSNFGENIVILAAGQSNMSRLMTNDKGISRILFENELVGKAGFKKASLINVAVGGSYITSDFYPDKVQYWVNTTDQSNYKPGPLLLKAMGEAKNNKADLDMMLWNQGEADSSLVPTYTNKEEYVKGLKYIIQQIRLSAENPNLPIGIISTGRSKLSKDTHGYQEIRQAQYDVANSDENVFIMASTYDLPLVDHVHYSILGREILIKDRLVPKIIECLKNGGSNIAYSGPLSNYKLPYVISANATKTNATGTRIILTIANGTNDLIISPRSKKLFSIFDNTGTSVANVASISSNGPNSIFLDLNRRLNYQLIKTSVLYTAFSGQKDFIEASGTVPVMGIYNGVYPQGLPLQSTGVKLKSY